MKPGQAPEELEDNPGPPDMFLSVQLVQVLCQRVLVQLCGQIVAVVEKCKLLKHKFEKFITILYGNSVPKLESKQGIYLCQAKATHKLFSL